MTIDCARDFAAAIAGSDQEADLFGAAMVVARLSGRSRDPNDVARDIDLIAEAVLEQAGPKPEAHALEHAIDHELFIVRGIRGIAEPVELADGLLDLVLEQRCGDSAAIAILYIEVASRVGLVCDAVGLPGQVIVRCGGPDQPVYIDPVQQGARLDRDELLARLRSDVLHGATPESFLAGLTRRQLLQRQLHGLHAVLRRERDLDPWLAAVEMLLCIEPWNASLVGERGMLRYRIGEPQQALEDLERYVAAGGVRSVSRGALRLLDELRLRFGGSEGRQ